MVWRRILEGVFRLEDSFRHERASVLVRKPIEHPSAVFASPDHPGEPELRQMLRNRSRWLLDEGCQVAHRELLVT
jgi:hypothetical protein